MRDGDQYVVDLHGCVRLQSVCFATCLLAKVRVPNACSIAFKCPARRLIGEQCSWLQLCSSVELRSDDKDDHVSWKRVSSEAETLFPS